MTLSPNTIERTAPVQLPEAQPVAPEITKKIGSLSIADQVEILGVSKGMGQILVEADRAEHLGQIQPQLKPSEAERLRSRDEQLGRIENAKGYSFLRRVGATASAYVELAGDRVFNGPVPTDRRRKK